MVSDSGGERNALARRRLFRDGLLAAATGICLLIGVSVSGVQTETLVDPWVMTAGCGGMVGIELVLLRVPDLTRRLWERPSIRLASTLSVVSGGGIALSLGATWAVGVVGWGLMAYLLLTVVVLLTSENPLARLV